MGFTISQSDKILSNNCEGSAFSLEDDLELSADEDEDFEPSIGEDSYNEIDPTKNEPVWIHEETEVEKIKADSKLENISDTEKELSDDSESQEVKIAYLHEKASFEPSNTTHNITSEANDTDSLINEPFANDLNNVNLLPFETESEECFEEKFNDNVLSNELNSESNNKMNQEPYSKELINASNPDIVNEAPELITELAHDNETSKVNEIDDIFELSDIEESEISVANYNETPKVEEMDEIFELSDNDENEINEVAHDYKTSQMEEMDEIFEVSDEENENSENSVVNDNETSHVEEIDEILELPDKEENEMNEKLVAIDEYPTYINELQSEVSLSAIKAEVQSAKQAIDIPKIVDSTTHENIIKSCLNNEKDVYEAAGESYETADRNETNSNIINPKKSFDDSQSSQDEETIDCQASLGKNLINIIENLNQGIECLQSPSRYGANVNISTENSLKPQIDSDVGKLSEKKYFGKNIELEENTKDSGLNPIDAFHNNLQPSLHGHKRIFMENYSHQINTNKNKNEDLGFFEPLSDSGEESDEDDEGSSCKTKSTDLGFLEPLSDSSDSEDETNNNTNSVKKGMKNENFKTYSKEDDQLGDETTMVSPKISFNNSLYKRPVKIFQRESTSEKLFWKKDFTLLNGWKLKAKQNSLMYKSRDGHFFNSRFAALKYFIENNK